MDKRNIPYSKEAEQSVLGAAFLSKEALQKICDELNEEYFYLEANQKIFRVLNDLNSEGIPVDITIVTDRLESSKELSEVGNIEYDKDIPLENAAIHYIVSCDLKRNRKKRNKE